MFKPLSENNKKDNLYSIKISLLNYRKFDRIAVRKKQKRATSLKQNVFVKLGEFSFKKLRSKQRHEWNIPKYLHMR